MNRPRRSSLSVLCARATLAVFAAALPGPAAWAQAAARVAPVAPLAVPAAVIAGLGSSLAAPSSDSPSPLAAIPALAAAPIAAPSLAAAPQAAAAPAPTAAAALESMSARSAALTAPGASASGASALSARAFDAAASRPAESDGVLAASIPMPVPGLARASGVSAAASPRGVPPAKSWSRAAKAYLPSALLATGIVAASYVLQHFGIAPAHATAPLALLAGTLAPFGAAGQDGGLRALADALDKSVRETAKPGELLTGYQLAAKAVAVGGAGPAAKQLIKILVDQGRFMALSGERYVYSDLSDRFSDDFVDGEVNRAGKLALRGLKTMNDAPVPTDLAIATAMLGDALEILKTRDPAAAAQVEILFKNASYELLRSLLSERASRPDNDEMDRWAAEAHNRLAGKYFGVQLGSPVLDGKLAGELAKFIGDLKPSGTYPDAESDGHRIARGLDMLHLMLQGELPGGKIAPAVAFKPLDSYAYKALYEFGSDVTQKAAEGKMRPMIGRKAELRQMVKTLLRVEKNNPLVIGEKGVGKTAIVNGLAQMIVRGEIPELLGKNIVKIDLNKVVAGTQNRGMFEERLQAIIDAAKNSNGRVILFIDEIHMIVGSGSASGSQDAAQILKESLSDGSLSLIGATTMDEFRKIEKDGALMRRFNPVKLLAPTREEAEAIVEGVKPIYEKKHGVSISNETVRAAVALAARYVTDRQLPDSALDLMDDASAEVELKASEAKQSGNDAATKAVTPEDIAKEISMRTGIPAGKLNEDKKAALKNLPTEMKGQVIGQDEAVEAVAEAVQAGETGYRDPKQPIASFVFLGPTGVGKTELARALAKIKFGSEKNMLRLDMSEYQEKHSVSRLISAPPGYVGHDEGGQLTESIRRNPYQVILLDEIEKAHPDVFDVLLQVLEDGRLTDGAGRTVDFSNTIIVMTSNIGGSVSGEPKDEKKADEGWRDGGDGFEYKQDGIGFGARMTKRPKAGTGRTPERTKHYVDAFKAKYRPEFVNRVGEDRVIVFNEIAERSKLGLILDLRLKALESQLKDKGLKVALTDGAREAALSAALAQSQYGARPIKQIVDRQINRALKDAELAGRIADGDAVLVDWDAAAGRYTAGRVP